MLDRKKILNGLDNKEIGVTVLDDTTSTNDFFDQLHTFHVPSVCIAEHQTQGRGRLSRNWHSPYGQNIHLSLLYKFKKNIAELSGLNLVTGLAVKESLNQFHELNIKWPNDLLYKNQKLAGILIETTSLGNSTYVIAGIGVNVNMEECDINKSWTSLKKITGTTLNRNMIIAKLTNNLISYYKDFETNGFEDFTALWNTQDILFGKQISLQQDESVFEGQSLGVNAKGDLLLKLDGGTIKPFSHGDASVIHFEN